MVFLPENINKFVPNGTSIILKISDENIPDENNYRFDVGFNINMNYKILIFLLFSLIKIDVFYDFQDKG